MSGPSRRRHTVELWWTSVLRAPVSRGHLMGLLDDSERRRAERFRVQSAHERFLVSRAMLRCLLAHRLGLSPDRVSLDTGPYGKPNAGPHSGAGHFNLSHSGDVAVVALGDRQLGVDVEWLRPVHQAARLAERFFADHESRWLMAQPEGDRDRAFLELWTCKEAVLKAIGVGLSAALSAVEVDPRRPAVIRSPHDGERDDPWSLLVAELPVPAVCAVATRGEGWRLEVRQFDWRSVEGFRLNVES